jgi:hypothetical protein
MDDVVNRYARELADAIAAAVAESPEVEACRARARAEGFEMQLTLEAVVGFANRPEKPAGEAVEKATVPAVRSSSKRSKEMTANDRRFLRSLRIASDDAKVEETDRPA